MILPGFPDAAPLAGLGGGLLIGLASALLLLGIGRIAGVSGIAARAFGLTGGGMERPFAWAFVIGLPIGAEIVLLLSGGLPATFANPLTLAIAGVVVGIGTRIGSGCTSGHGVCGISRLAPRSLLATVVFMGAGIATVALMKALGWNPLS